MNDFDWDVFVSHNRKSKPWVRELVRQWRDKLDLKVFFDEDSILPGESVIDAIERGLQGSRHTVLIITPESMESKWVAREMAMIIQDDPDAAGRRLIPVRLEPLDDAKIGAALRMLKPVDLATSKTRTQQYWYLLECLQVRRPKPWPDPPELALEKQKSQRQGDDTDRLISTIRSEIAKVHRDLLEQMKSAERTTELLMEKLAAGIVRYEGQSYRSLRYAPKQGAMYYGDMVAGNRNVLFNNETIKKMFQEIQKVQAKDSEKGRSLLHSIGYAASKRFAQHFQKHVENKGIAFELRTWLKEWTAYDSNAGFGHMEIGELNQDRQTAEVVIRNSFLTHGDDFGGGSSLCEFMVGYIEGLLKNFAPALYESMQLDSEGIKVKHDRKDCCNRHRDRSKGCIFRVEVPSLKSDS